MQNLTPTASRLLDHLQRNGRITATNSELASALGVQPRNAQRAKAQLVMLGLVTIELPPAGDRSGVTLAAVEQVAA